MKPSKKNLIWIAPLALLGMALFAFMGGQLVKQLWNWLLPALFGFREISFWQALGMLVLCRILFGGFGFQGSQRSQSGRRIGERIGDRIVERIAERWEKMTPEERERLRQRMGERWGFGRPVGETKEL